jgi:hypothetical protein
MGSWSWAVAVVTALAGIAGVWWALADFILDHVGTPSLDPLVDDGGG